MSRAFVREDADDDRPKRTYSLPPRDDPDYDRAAARALLEGARIGETFAAEEATSRALLEGARIGETVAAEEATGYQWGEPRLRPHVERILSWAREARDERLEQVAERFLR